MPISGFVVSYNREATIETCLRSIRFVDELIVLDKSSTDGTARIAARFADRVITVPWSPTVEETRSLALDHCQYDRIAFLDDDECFSPEAIRYLDRELRHGNADLYSLPCRHHVLGRHDEGAYYWPQRHIRAFGRGALTFESTVHGGERLSKGAMTAEPAFDSGVCFHNISHPDAAAWVEKTNRYTSRRDRKGSVSAGMDDLFAASKDRLDHWIEKSGHSSSRYAQSVAILRAVYDLVDLVKHWEQQEGGDGEVLFAETCQRLQRDYDRLEAETGIDTSARTADLDMANGPAIALIADSDKHFWHRYTETYLAAFAKLGTVRRILEFGVHHGASIRWLRSRFQQAEIVGVDILPVQPTWPQDAGLTYRVVDQADRTAVADMLADAGSFDLMIEDGSHVPQHQVNCLVEGLRRVRPGGLYILEDICTSHPLQAAFRHYSLIDGRQVPTALHVLLAIIHRKEIGGDADADFVGPLAHPGFCSSADVRELFATIDRATMYRRSVLPLRCYACGSTDFDYVAWRCQCGVALYEPANSMAVLLWKASSAPSASALSSV